MVHWTMDGILNYHCVSTKNKSRQRWQLWYKEDL